MPTFPHLGTKPSTIEQTSEAAIEVEQALAQKPRQLVVLGLQGESPPGFTAVALLDESHVTAHCYSTTGQLAVDVFTCGVHDPRPIADDLRAAILEHAQGVRCVSSSVVGRFPTDAQHRPVLLHDEPPHMPQDANVFVAQSETNRRPTVSAVRMTGMESERDAASATERRNEGRYPGDE